jgi:hypothetical protein
MSEVDKLFIFKHITDFLSFQFKYISPSQSYNNLKVELIINQLNIYYPKRRKM